VVCLGSVFYHISATAEYIYEELCSRNQVLKHSISMKKLARKLSLRKDKSNTSSQTSSRKASEAVPEEPKQQTETKQLSNMSGGLPKSYKAAVVVGEKKPLEIQELPMPELKDGEIIIKVKACGVCGSDHHVLQGDFGPP
jgi:hypothetical protein